MSWGLVTRASSGWRRVIGTGSSGGSTGSSRGSARSKTVYFKRPALHRIVIFALWYGSGLWRIKTFFFFLFFFIKAGLVQNRHFWALVRVRVL